MENDPFKIAPLAFRDHNPLVSIIIPVHNREKMAPEAVESALEQTYPHIEVVVVDDGSTDRTYECLKTFLPDITLIRQSPNQGQSAARNRGISVSKGRHVLFLDSDDVLVPSAVDKLKRALTRLEQDDPGWGVAYGKRLTCDESLNPLKTRSRDYFTGHILDRMLTHPLMHTGTYLVRKAAMEEIGGFREDLAVKEDLLVHLLLAARYKFCFVDEVVVKYRRHRGDRARDNTFSIIEQGTKHLDQFFACHPSADRIQMKRRSAAYAAEHLQIGKFAWRSGLAEDYLIHWKALCTTRKRYLFHPKYLYRALICKIKMRL